MKKSVKRFIVSALSVMSVSSSILGLNANATNGGNPFYSFTINPSVGTYTRLNDVESKYTYSYVYLYVTSATRDFYIQTLGIDSYGLTHNCTWYTTVHCSKNKRYMITNSIKESGYNAADLQFCLVSSYNYDTLSGDWSPDSSPVAGETYTYV